MRLTDKDIKYLQNVATTEFGGFAQDLADNLGVHNIHVYRARRGDITPMFARAVSEHAAFDWKLPKRRRLYVEIPEHLTDWQVERMRADIFGVRDSYSFVYGALGDMYGE